MLCKVDTMDVFLANAEYNCNILTPHSMVIDMLAILGTSYTPYTWK